MKKRALAIALSLALLLSVFVPGTLATSSTETETDTTTVVSQSDTEVLAEDGEGTQSGDEQTALTDGETVTGDGQTTDEDSVTGDGQTAGEGTVTGDGQTAGEGTVTGDGQTTEEGTVTGDGQTAGEGTVTDDGQTVDEGNVTGDGQTADPTETTAATDPTVATDPTETTAATDPTETTGPVCTCPGTEEEKAAEGFAHQEGCPYYVETAPAMPQLMMMIAADIRAGGSETIDSKWFEFSGGVEKPGSFSGVEEGEITTGKVPDIDGYTFVGAYVEDIPVVRIGQIVFEGKTYVYYTTDGSSDVAAMVLDDGDTIELRYSLDAVSITYSVTVGGETVGDYGYTVEGVPYGGSTNQPIQVVPSTNPTEVFPGSGYSFTVEIPRGYHAKVYVNDVKQDQELGRFPTYKNDGTEADAIITSDPQPMYRANYSVANAKGEQNVRVELEEVEPEFSASLITDTKYFEDDEVPRATYRVNGVPGTTGTITNGSVTWTVTTNRNQWRMNKLEINGTKIEVPFSNDSSKETTLPSGTVVTVTRIVQGNNYVYSIACTNCYEDLVVTAGNLNGVSHQEYMPWEYVGVAQAQYYHGGKWNDLTIGVPVAKNELETSSTSESWSVTTTKYTAQFRFQLLPGYGYPNLTINDKGIDADLGTDGWFTTGVTEVYSTKTRWGLTTTDEKGFGDYTRNIKIIAQTIDVTVEYQEGTVNDATDIPEDAEKYNLTTNPQVRIPTTIPMDPSNDMVFQGWQNGDEIYLPNAVIDLEDLAIENGKVTFTAQWIVASQAKQIQFTIQIVNDSDELLDKITSSAPNGVPIILDVNSDTIQTWLDEHPEYEISDDNTLYHKSISQGDVVDLIVKEKTATITYSVVGPTGAGKVDPASESVKVTADSANGSTPTASNGYRFVGWYTDIACTQQVDTGWVDADNKLTPQRSIELWEDATYYAKFEPAVASLTITARGIEDTYDTQGTIYKVEVDAADGESDKTFYVSISGEDSVTINNLPYGEYTVTPMNDWSWRYGDLGPQAVTPTVQGNGTMAASVTFDYGIQSYKWLSGNEYFACN